MRESRVEGLRDGGDGGEGGAASTSHSDVSVAAKQVRVLRASSTASLAHQLFTHLSCDYSPFIRPKFGRQQISTAMEQREACKSLEKVLVQNIQFGLSPSLTEAITSVSR